MNFMHLWALGIGAAAIAGPVLVHWLTKPRPVSYPLATFRFLREVLDEKRAKDRLRDWLVLLLRTLAIGLLAMALARPWLDQSNTIREIPQEATARVIVLDISQSMGTNVGGSNYLQRAQAIAIRYLESSTDLHANVVLAGAKPRSEFATVSTNMSALKDFVRTADVVHEAANVKAAMLLANSMLTKSSGKKLELVVVSDFQRSNWSNLYLNEIDKEIRVQLESVSMPNVGNIAISRCQPKARVTAGNEYVIEVDVANFSDEDVSIPLSLELGNQSSEVRAAVKAQSTETFNIRQTAPSPQWLSGWATLKKHVDALASDNARPISLRIEKSPRIALLQRSNGINASNEGSFYLEQALQVVLDDTQADSRLMQIAIDEQPNYDWLDADIYLLNKPGALDSELTKFMAERLRNGKSLVYCASSIVDGMNLEQLSRQLGSSYSPPVEFLESSASRSELGVRNLRQRVAPFALFGDSAMATFQTVQIGTGLESRLREGGLKDQILGELTDGSAWLTKSACDAGQIAIINTDLDRSNWATQPSFVPFLGELVQSLLVTKGSKQEPWSGVPMVQMIEGVSKDAKLRFDTLDTRSELAVENGQWEWSTEQACWIWSWNDPTGPGNYALRAAGEVAHAVSISTPSSESDTKSLDASLLQGRLAGARAIAVKDLQSSQSGQEEWWTWLILACTFGMLAEIVTLRLFSA